MAIYDENKLISGQTVKNPMRDYPIYQSNYYTGADISIYFGDTWVDEINAIQFVTEEKYGPIYGYADYTWAYLAKGNRMAHGAFSMNFTEAGYLESVLDRMAAHKLDNIPNLVSREANVITKQSISNMDFEAYAQQQEDAIWGELNDKDYKKNTNTPGLIKYTFDIVIGYGATSGSNPLQVMPGLNKPSSTMQILKNVSIVGSSQQIDTSDNALVVTYEFIAQDVVIPN